MDILFAWDLNEPPPSGHRLVSSFLSGDIPLFTVYIGKECVTGKTGLHAEVDVDVDVEEGAGEVSTTMMTDEEVTTAVRTGNIVAVEVDMMTLVVEGDQEDTKIDTMVTVAVTVVDMVEGPRRMLHHLHTGSLPLE
jgi:hypothetical protein